MRNKVNKVTIGADPELFMRKDDEIVSAEGLIGGTKDDPKYITEDGHAIQEDNVMMEFNVPPSDNAIKFVEDINLVKEHLTTLAALHDSTIAIVASAELDQKWLNTDQARLFGCEPDFDVYLKRPNDAPDPEGTLRTAGGHIHIGFEEPTQEVQEEIIYAMDMILGLESVTLDKDDRRKEMYGKAGCFRFKDYGVEYRSLSNFWIATDELITWAFDKTMEAVDLVNSGVVLELVEKFGDQVKLSIDDNDKSLAVSLQEKIEAHIIEKEVVTT